MPVPWSFETAFDRLFYRAEEAARDVVGDRATAESVAIDALAAAYRQWDRVHGRDDLDDWVLGLAAELAAKVGVVPSIAADAPRRTTHQLLELAVDRAERLRRRRRSIVAAVVAFAVALAVGVPVALTNDSSHRVVVAAPPTTAIPFSSPAFVDTTLPTGTSTTALTTATTVVTTTTGSGPTTSIACRNSTDQRCGTFRWDPNPGANQPLDIEMTYTPADPHPGDVITFTAHVVDPDASPITAGEETCNPPAYDGPPSRCAPTCRAPGYGPWTPPPRHRGERTVTYSHAYSQAGTFTANFWFGSAGACAGNPYSSAAESAVVINVS